MDPGQRPVRWRIRWNDSALVLDLLIQTTMLLSAITVMYPAAKAATDKEYRSQFIDPMLQDLQRNLIARARYRAARDEESA